MELTTGTLFNILRAAIAYPERKQVTSMLQYMELMGITNTYLSSSTVTVTGLTDIALTGNSANLTFNQRISWAYTPQGEKFWFNHLVLAAVLSRGSGRSDPQKFMVRFIPGNTGYSLEEWEELRDILTEL